MNFVVIERRITSEFIAHDSTPTGEWDREYLVDKNMLFFFKVQDYRIIRIG